MKEIRIKKSDFDFRRFVAAITDFIEETFGSDSPAETMRYFYSFSQKIAYGVDPELTEINNKMDALIEKHDSKEISEDEFKMTWMELIQDEFLRKEEVNMERLQKNNCAPFTDIDPEEWEMEEFKDAVIKGGEMIFFPFSSGLYEDGSVSLANGKTVQLDDVDEADAEEDNPGIGMTDCFGFLVNLAEGKFEINSAIAWGDQVSSIEIADHAKIDPAMIKYIKTFLKKKVSNK